jgi:hypothetical protein
LSSIQELLLLLNPREEVALEKEGDTQHREGRRRWRGELPPRVEAGRDRAGESGIGLDGESFYKPT